MTCFCPLTLLRAGGFRDESRETLGFQGAEANSPGMYPKSPVLRRAYLQAHLQLFAQRHQARHPPCAAKRAPKPRRAGSQQWQPGPGREPGGGLPFPAAYKDSRCWSFWSCCASCFFLFLSCRPWLLPPPLAAGSCGLLRRAWLPLASSSSSPSSSRPLRSLRDIGAGERRRSAARPRRRPAPSLSPSLPALHAAHFGFTSPAGRRLPPVAATAPARLPPAAGLRWGGAGWWPPALPAAFA